MVSAMEVGDFLKFGDREELMPARALSRVRRHPIIRVVSACSQIGTIGPQRRNPTGSGWAVDPPEENSIQHPRTGPYGQDLTHGAKQMRMIGSFIVHEVGGKRLWRTRAEIGQSSLAHLLDRHRDSRDNSIRLV